MRWSREDLMHAEPVMQSDAEQIRVMIGPEDGSPIVELRKLTKNVHGDWREQRSALDVQPHVLPDLIRALLRAHNLLNRKP